MVLTAVENLTNMDCWQSDIHIVLTGTIVPSASFTVVSDPSRRRQEYLDSIRYYSQFGPVHFLENSGYDLGNDLNFRSTDRVTIRQFPASAFPQRGKGFQEFEMLDAWISSGDGIPAKWTKVTGRYTLTNVNAVLKDCLREPSCPLVIDLCRRPKIARTHLFCVETEFYKNYLLGSYRDCNDQSGDWIERVLFRRIQAWKPRSSRTFGVEPNVRAISGSTGGLIESSLAKHQIKSVLRSVNRLFDKQYLWYAG